MLQQPSEFIMYQKLPLNLNMMHSAGDVVQSNLRSDFKDIGLHLQQQAHRAAAATTQAFFLDAYTVKSGVPCPAAVAVPVIAAIPGVYEYPFQAVYDPLASPQLRHPYQHPQQQEQQKLHYLQHHLQIQHQQQQELHSVPVASVAELQQQQRQQLERRGCWLPNWQEVLHGISASKEEKQKKFPSSQQQPTDQAAIEVPQVPATAYHTKATLQRGMHPDGGQILDSGALPSPLSNHAADVPLPHPTPEAEKKRKDVPTLTAHVNVPEQHARHVESDVMGEFHPSSTVPTADIVYCSGVRSERSLVTSTDLRDHSLPSSTGAVITESPAWLPPGWITEVQVRRTGTTAGTRDKYYKDLVSGRRFRSRNEVIHFLQTGKGRIRRRRRRRAIPSSGFEGTANCVTHQMQSLGQKETSSQCLFLAPQPVGIVVRPLLKSQPAHNPSSVVLPMATEEVEPPCQTPVADSGTSSTPVMFGLKRTAESRLQKSPVHKKAKVLSPKKCEDKQASRLWQWLHKPVTMTEEQPQTQSSFHGERQTPDIEIQTKAEDQQGRQLQNLQRSAELGRDVETAQRTISQLGMEMQVTIEKLTERIQAAKRDLKLEAGATHRTDGTISSIALATERFNSAVGDLTGATQSLVSALDHAIRETQAADSCVGVAPPTGKLSQGIATVERALGFDAAMVHSASRSYAAHVAGSQEHEKGNSVQIHTFSEPIMTGSSDPSRRPDNTNAHITQAAQSADADAHHNIEPRTCIAQTAQLSNASACYVIQRPIDFAMCDPINMPQSSGLISSYGSGQVVSSGMMDTRGAMPNTEKLDQDMHAYHKVLEVSRQIMEAGNRHMRVVNFASLNPKLDLSLLSPSLSSRQRAKEVQKMKAKYARGLLVILGRRLCYKAISKGCKEMH